MKKLTALLLALTMILTMAACASTETKNPAADVPADDLIATMPDDQTPNEEDTDLNAPAEMPEETPVEDEELPEVETMPAEKLQELTALVDQLVEGFPAEMSVMIAEITSDMYEYYAIPAMDGAYVVAHVPMMSSIAHELLLVEVPEGTDVEEVAAHMEANMNPIKWLCVEAEETWVKTSGQYVVMVMSSKDNADIISANFDKVFNA